MKNWKAVPCRCGDERCTSYRVQGLHMCDGRMSKEDALLVAAAPDLITAVQMAVSMLKNNGTITKVSAIHDELSAALDKALGQ